MILSEELLELIIYAMEDQESKKVFDREKNTLIPLPPGEEIGKRYLPLPPWTSAHGFQLMGGFVTYLHNPLLKKKLKLILESGTKVFRRFKDELSATPAGRKLWETFKRRKMYDHIAEWFMQYDLALGEYLEEDEGEQRDLIFCDFGITFSNGEKEGVGEVTTLSGESAATMKWTLDGENICRVTSFSVEEEFRGLGLGRHFMGAFLGRAAEKSLKVSLFVPSQSEFMIDALRELGYAVEGWKLQWKPEDS